MYDLAKQGVCQMYIEIDMDYELAISINE